MKQDLAKFRAIFNEVDPVGIFFEKNVDEYDAEINELLKTSPDFSDVKELQSKLKDIFARYFEGIEIKEDRILSLAEKLNATVKK
jgi:hypothetical protein